MSNELDFEGLAKELLSRSREILPLWLPGGRLIGHEYMCGNLRGENGDSLRINVNTGLWADFAGTEKGGDLISLYAAIEGIKQGEAARRLASDTGYELRETKPYNPETDQPKPETKAAPDVTKPPIDEPAPNMKHPTFGEPSLSWCYRDAFGEPLFYVARYDSEDGKQIIPWSWSVDGKWVCKGWPSPRPLYGLADLAENPGKPVLVVEGEKSAEAAKQIVSGKYTVMTWPNGAKAIKNADWSVLQGRNVLIWPDADKPGMEAAKQIADLLKDICQQVKVIEAPEEPAQKGWDAADALAEGWDWQRLKAWAVPRAVVVKMQQNNVDIKVQQNVQVNVQTDEDITDASSYALWDKYGIVTTKNGQPVCNVDNILRVFEQMPEMKELVWFDKFHGKYFTLWNSKKPREWCDVDDLKIMARLQRKLGLLRISDDLVRKAVMIYADQYTRNEPFDWMESLKWDGVSRLEEFFITHFQTPESDYARAASKNWWISMVARVYHPGCKVDNMVILEGAQGKFKSTALAVIGGNWYAEAHESVTSKDFYMVLSGKLIVEISELDAFSKAEVNTIKKVITCQTDRYRPPYGRAAQDFPRQCVFVGTTNEDSYLKDHTGARRFWPVEIGEINIDKIKTDREQLFAEAVHRYKAGETWHIMPAGQTAEQQESRRQTDEWESSISDFLKIKFETTISEVAVEALKIDIGKLDRMLQLRIAKILRVLGWSKHNFERDGRQFKAWRSPEFYEEELPF